MVVVIVMAATTAGVNRGLRLRSTAGVAGIVGLVIHFKKRERDVRSSSRSFAGFIGFAEACSEAVP